MTHDLAPFHKIFHAQPRSDAAASQPLTLTLAFIGLGAMGAPMAAHLLAAGHHVRVFNRSADKAQAWVHYWVERCPAAAERAQAAPTIAHAVRGAHAVITCVGRDEDLRQLCLGAGTQDKGAFAHMDSGALFIDHTTTSAHVARDMSAAAQAQGLHFIDAPVSGGQAGAQQGQLSIMCGGEVAAIERACPIMAAYARAITHIGAAGSGQLAKMVNQITLAGLIQSLAEAVAFAQKNGLDIDRVLQATSCGAAQSWQMDHRTRSMAARQFDFGFAVDWMRKDLGIALEQARASGAALPVAALVDQFYAQIQAAGGGRWDTSSLITRLDTPHSQP